MMKVHFSIFLMGVSLSIFGFAGTACQQHSQCNEPSFSMQNIADTGKVYFGVKFLDECSDPEKKQGLTILEVVPNSTAQLAGLQAGDVLLAIDQYQIGADGTLAQILSHYNPHTTARITYLRNGEKFEPTAMLSSKGAKQTADESTCKPTCGEISETEKIEQAKIIARLKAQTIERKELDNGFAFRLPYAPDSQQIIQDFIKTEGKCCSFLNFKTVPIEGSTEIWLEITGNKEFVQQNY